MIRLVKSSEFLSETPRLAVVLISNDTTVLDIGRDDVFNEPSCNLEFCPMFDIVGNVRVFPPLSEAFTLLLIFVLCVICSSPLLGGTDAFPVAT